VTVVSILFVLETFDAGKAGEAVNGD